MSDMVINKSSFQLERPASAGKIKTENLTLWLLVGYAFFSSLVVLPIGPDGIRIGFSDLVFPLAVVLMFLSPRYRKNPASYWLMAYAVLALIFLLVQPIVGEKEKLMKWFRFLALIWPFFLASKVRWDDEKIFKVVNGFFYGGAISVVIGIVLYHMGVQVSETQQRLWDLGGIEVYRAGGLLGNTGYYGHVTALWGLVVFLFSEKLVTGDRIRLIVRLGSASLCAYGLFVSASRSGLLLIITALIVYIVAKKDSVRVFAAYLIITAVAIGTIWIVITSLELFDFSVVEKTLDRFNIFEDFQSGFWKTSRFDTWGLLIESFQEAPLIGVGFRSGWDILDAPLDNLYLAALYETGIIGFLMIAGFAVSLLVDAIRQVKNKSLYGPAFIALIVGELSRGMVGNIFTSWAVTPAALTLIGALYGANYIRHKRYT